MFRRLENVSSHRKSIPLYDSLTEKNTDIFFFAVTSSPDRPCFLLSVSQEGFWASKNRIDFLETDSLSEHSLNYTPGG